MLLWVQPLTTTSGEEVSISLVYALGLRTDQTPPIRASKRNTAGKAKTKWVPNKANLGKTSTMTGPKRTRANCNQDRGSDGHHFKSDEIRRDKTIKTSNKLLAVTAQMRH
jgi:hypothetical protein